MVRTIRARSVALAVLCAAALGANGAPVAAQPAPPSTGTPRTVTIRGVTLGSGEAIGIALHPGLQPMQLRADAPGLEVCPGMPDGNLTWRTLSGFVACRPFEPDASGGGRITLPSVGVEDFHLAFHVRAADGAATRIERLTLDYVPGDGFFFVRPPPIPPRAWGPSVVFTPVTASAFSVRAERPGGVVLAPHARIVPMQGRHRVPRSAAPAQGREPAQEREPAWGPVRAGKPVTVGVYNRGDAPVATDVFISWE